MKQIIGYCLSPDSETQNKIRHLYDSEMGIKMAVEIRSGQLLVCLHLGYDEVVGMMKGGAFSHGHDPHGPRQPFVFLALQL